MYRRNPLLVVPEKEYAGGIISLSKERKHTVHILQVQPESQKKSRFIKKKQKKLSIQR